MTFLPLVTRARYCGGHRIHLTFNDLSEVTVDFLPWLKGPVFEPLKEPAHFQQFFLDGGTVAWPCGADIAPETLYEAVASKRRRGKRLQRPAAKGSSKQPVGRTRNHRGAYRGLG